MALQDKIIEEIEELPPLNQVVRKIHEMIAGSNASAKEIADVIETDQVIATEVLKIANSAYYGMIGKISSIQRALIVLGFNTLGEIVTLVGIKGTLNRTLPGYGYDTKELWNHSLSVAIGAKIIAESKYPALKNEAYTAGLIHDVGKIILDPYVLMLKDQIELYMEKEEKTYLEAEDHFFSFNHADVASGICEKWNIPEFLANAIKCHHSPAKSQKNELAYILHMADQSARLLGEGYDDDDFLYTLEAGTMDFLGLKQEDVSKILTEIIDSIERFSH